MEKIQREKNEFPEKAICIFYHILPFDFNFRSRKNKFSKHFLDLKKIKNWLSFVNFNGTLLC